MLYNSSCRACNHQHHGEICRWQILKIGQIDLRPVYSEGLWGIGSSLHSHVETDDGKGIIYKQFINSHKDEKFEYKQEMDCGCRCYIPSENLEFLEWKYDEFNKSI